MRFIRSITQTLRASGWWNYKLPPLFAISYLFVWLTEVVPAEAAIRLGLLLLWMVGAAGFGYYLNNSFDVRQDLKAGKENQASKHSVAMRIFILGLLLLIAYFPWMIMASFPGLLLVTLHIFTFVLYSVPPVRLKERGWAGIALDSIYAHLLPVLIVICAFSEPEIREWYLLIFLIAAWQLLVGIKNIILHQLEDNERDKLAGVRTLLTENGVEKGKRIVGNIIYPLEILVFITIVSFVALLEIWLAGILVALFLTFKYVRYRYFYPVFFKSFKNRLYFMNDFYDEDLPVIFLILLGLQTSLFWAFLVVHLILFPNFYLRIIKDFRRAG